MRNGKKQWMDYFGPHGHIRMCLVVKAPRRLKSHHVSYTKVWTHRNWFYVLSAVIVKGSAALLKPAILKTAVNMTCSVFQQYICQRWFHLQVLFPEKERDRRMDGGMATLVFCSCCVCCVKSAFFYWKRIALRFYCLHITLKLRFVLRRIVAEAPAITVIDFSVGRHVAVLDPSPVPPALCSHSRREWKTITLVSPQQRGSAGSFCFGCLLASQTSIDYNNGYCPMCHIIDMGWCCIPVKEHFSS